MYRTSLAAALVLLAAQSGPVSMAGPKGEMSANESGLCPSELARLARIVAGDPTYLRSVVDGGTAGVVSFVGITGVNPTNGSSYASDVVLAGGNFTLDGGDARLWFELQLGGWWGGVLDTFQLSVDQQAFSNGVGADLQRPVVNCDATATPPFDAAPCGGGEGVGLCDGGANDGEPCLADWYCLGGICDFSLFGALGPGSKCTDFPATPIDRCDIGFQDVSNPRFAINGISAVNQTNLGFGSTKLPGFVGEQDDGHTWYAGNLVLDALGARGTYTLKILSSAATFLVLDTGEIRIDEFREAIVDVPIGRCCVISDSTCQHPVTKAECDNLGGIFQVGPDCTTGCCECDSSGPWGDAACDDGDFCTTERCFPPGGCGFCEREPIDGWDPGTECCSPYDASQTDISDGDNCTDDFCSLGGSSGVSVHVPSASGTPCDDGNLCTFDDRCDGTASQADGGCAAGIDANLVACDTDDDCLQVTGMPLACVDRPSDPNCPGGRCCYCEVDSSLTFVIDPGDADDPNCFDDGEKVTATVHVGPSLAVVITGGELAISYDPSCMVLNGTITIAPFNNILFIDTDTPGEIFVAVGIDLGGAGVGGGNFDLLALSFAKAGGCAACNLCFTDVNPRGTRLTTSDGQAVTVSPECSKDVRGDGVLTIDVPDDSKVNTECGRASTEVTWGTPSAADTCQLDEFWCGGLYQDAHTGAVVDVGDIGVDPYSGGRFPVGDATFCCDAANDCGETGRDCWTVTVNDQTSLDVDLALSPTMAATPGVGLTRCVTFEVFANCATAPLVFSENVVFGGLFDMVGKVNTSLKIPTAGQFGCITARDQLHTLRGCYTFGAGDCDANGVLHATFKGDPFFGGNWLVGGNLDGFKKDSAAASLNAIDITDFGMFVSQYPTDLGAGATPCAIEGPNADINGDGLVDLLDFTFITMNFLEDSKDCCCPGGGAASAARSGRTRITVKALRQGGLADLAVADLDGDGDVDLDDMSALLHGQVPTRKSPIRFRGR